MQSNRIQHFLFTNNLPSGLSYRTSILSSTVYYEGAEGQLSPPGLFDYSKGKCQRLLQLQPLKFGVMVH